MTIQDLAKCGQALSEPARIRILAALRQSELCVCEICDALELTQSTLSSHLQFLRQAGFVHTRKEGKWIYYGLEQSVSPLLASFFKLGATALAENKRISTDAKRAAKRLKLRKRGSCVLGFNEIDRKGGEKK
jgi:ArsR family transcriptional regulator